MLDTFSQTENQKHLSPEARQQIRDKVKEMNNEEFRVRLRERLQRLESLSQSFKLVIEQIELLQECCPHENTCLKEQGLFCEDCQSYVKREPVMMTDQVQAA